MRITPIRRALAAGASTAVALVGLSALAPTAQAAEATLKFNCAASILSNQEFVFDAKFDIPAQVKVGRTINATFSGTVTAPNSTRGAAYAFLNGRFLEGGATIDAKFGGAAVAMNATLPKTAIPAADGPMVIAATGGGALVADSLGAKTLTVDGFTAPLTMTKADGTTAPIEVTCVANAPATVVATVDVAQGTATTAKVTYAKKAKKAKTSVKVINDDKSAAQGKVKLTLKKGKKTVGKTTVKLNAKGKARVPFAKVTKKGKYTLTVQYQGGKGSMKSKSVVKFRVR